MNTAKKMVKTSLVGFCYPCQEAHIKEETFREKGELYCKRTGSLIYATDGMKPPIPVEVPQDDIEETLAAWSSEEPVEKPKPLSRTEQVEEFLDSLALMYDIDTEKHQKHWEYLVSQIVTLVDSKKPRMVKKVNKAALGTQLTLLAQEVEA